MWLRGREASAQTAASRHQRALRCAARAAYLALDLGLPLLQERCRCNDEGACERLPTASAAAEGRGRGGRLPEALLRRALRRCHWRTLHTATDGISCHPLLSARSSEPRKRARLRQRRGMQHISARTAGAATVAAPAAHGMQACRSTPRHGHIRRVQPPPDAGERRMHTAAAGTHAPTLQQLHACARPGPHPPIRLRAAHTPGAFPKLPYTRRCCCRCGFRHTALRVPCDTGQGTACLWRLWRCGVSRRSCPKRGSGSHD